MEVKQWLTRASVIALAMVAGMVLSSSIGPTSAAPEKAAVRAKWEYKVFLGTSEKELNKLGDDGWELTHVTGGEAYVSRTTAPVPNVGTSNVIAYVTVRHYFRRPK